MRDKAHAKARKAEIAAAQRWNAILTPGSGSYEQQKHDFRTQKELVEFKYTVNKSFSVNPLLMLELARNAVVEGKVPVLLVEVENAGRFVVLPEQTFLSIREWLENGT